MSTEVAESGPSSAAGFRFEEELSPRTHHADNLITNDNFKFYGGAYGLGAVALTVLASNSHEPHRAVTNALKGYGGLSGLFDRLTPFTSDMSNQPDALSYYCLINMNSILENFNSPSVIDTAHKIVKGSSKDSYCANINIDTVVRSTPAVVSVLEDGIQKKDHEELLRDLDKKSAVVRPPLGDIVLDMAGARTYESDKQTHSIPLARAILPRALRQTSSPYTWDSASLLFGVAAQRTLGASTLNVLDRDPEGNLAISSVSY